MKRLLFLMSDLEGGGAEKALVELLKSIDYERYKVSLCLMLCRGIYVKDVPANVKIIRLFESESSWCYRKAFKYYIERKCTWLLSFLLHTKLKRWKYDAIISFMEGDPLLLHSFIVNRAQTNISWVHCDLYHYHYSKKRFHEPVTEIGCYEKMDKLVFVSRFAMNNFDKLYSLKIPKSCLYNILDVNGARVLANNQHVLKNGFTIIAIGSLIEVKGIDRLIRVAKRLKDEGYSFCVQILGRGGREGELIDLRDKLELGEYVHFLGFQAMPYPYLKHSDILVSTSISEGLPYVICEACALGIPVVATETAGAMELLEDNKYGILTKHTDDAIFQGIKKLMDNEILRKEYGAKAEERAEAFGAQRIMKAFYQLVDDRK